MIMSFVPREETTGCLARGLLCQSSLSHLMWLENEKHSRQPALRSTPLPRSKSTGPISFSGKAAGGRIVAGWGLEAAMRDMTAPVVDM